MIIKIERIQEDGMVLMESYKVTVEGVTYLLNHEKRITGDEKLIKHIESIITVGAF